jgi:hypothetical protein
MIRTFLVLALLALLVLPTAAAEVPKQYRGEWCSGKWETIYRRCREGGPELALHNRAHEHGRGRRRV